MKKVDFNKLQAGDLVEVPRTQFAPMRSGWNRRHERTAVCSSSTEAVRNAGEVGEADSDSKGIYKLAYMCALGSVRERQET